MCCTCDSQATAFEISDASGSSRGSEGGPGRGQGDTQISFMAEQGFLVFAFMLRSSEGISLLLRMLLSLLFM